MPSESMSSANITVPPSSVQSFNGTQASSAGASIVTSVATSHSHTSKSSRKQSESRVIAPANGHVSGPVSAGTFLSVTPQQAYYSHPASNSGLTVASVQQQLQPGSVVFTSPTMAMALTGANQQQNGGGPGPQMGQQQPLVVGQAMAQQLQGFNPANGQPQMIQTQQMGMLPQVQVIGSNGQYFQPFYTPVNGQPVGQPMLLANNLTMIPAQNPGQPGLAIQIPNGTNGTMINQIAQQTATTPVKNNQPQPILKISPQHQGNKNSGQQTNRQSQGQQSNILQPATFQTAQSGNQTFVISPFNGQHGNQNGTILQSTPTNQRKSSGSGRTSSSGNKASGMIQKIQPATNNLTTGPLLAPAQFKTTTAQFATPNNQNSSANGQTIMVHGQNIQPGNGSIQLASGQIIPQVTSFQTQFQSPGITWGSQQQLVAAGPGQFYIRAPGSNDQPMIIQTSNNQFQTVQMQMGAQQPGQPTGTMQMQQAGQQIVATSINQQLPISIQTNQGVTMASTQMMAPQPACGPNLISVASSTTTSATITTVTNVVNASTPTTSSNVKQRLIRPANPITSSAPTSSCNSTSTNTSVKKPSDQNRVSTSGASKLAPKSVPVSNTLSRSSPSISTQAKLPLPVLPKLSDSSTLISSTVSGTLSTSTASTSNVGTKTTLALRVSTASINASLPTACSTSTGTNTLSSQHSINGATLVTNTTTTTTPKVSSTMSLNKNVNRKSQPEKRDSGIGTDTKGLGMNLPLPPNKVKLNVLRPQGKSMSSLSTPPLSNSLPANTQMINGVPCQIPTKNSVNSGLANGKSQTPNATKPPSASNATTKKKNSNKVLTHCIDGYVFQESTFPFPVGGYETSEKSDLKTSDASSEKVEDNDSQVKANSEDNKDVAIPKGLPEHSKQPEIRKNLCLQCNQRERMQTVKKKLKRFCSQACYEEYWAHKQQQQQQNSLVTPNGNSSILNGGGSGATKRPLATQTQTPQSQESKRLKADTANGISVGTSNGGDMNDNDVDDSMELELAQVWLPYEGKKAPDEWTVSDVKDFIIHMFPNTTGISDQFESQDIDGRALMLIKEDHIIDILNMKLGPALKLGSKLRLLKMKYKIKT